MIGGIDLTSVILGLITLLGGCGWVIDRKKHRQEIEALKADIRQKNLDLSTEFVEKFKELIAKPLENEVVNLRTEVNEGGDGAVLQGKWGTVQGVPAEAAGGEVA